MLQVVSKSFTERSGTVIIRGDTQGEVSSSAARKMALEAAVGSLNRPGTGPSDSPYPCDAAGNTSEDLILGRNGTVVDHYRCDYTITAGI